MFVIGLQDLRSWGYWAEGEHPGLR